MHIGHDTELIDALKKIEDANQGSCSTSNLYII